MTKTRILIVLFVLGIISLAPALTTAFSSMPEVGQPAPDFTLKNQDGKHVSLKDYKGKWIVLYFYPKDFTGGCTLEAVEAIAKKTGLAASHVLDGVSTLLENAMIRPPAEMCCAACASTRNVPRRFTLITLSKVAASPFPIGDSGMMPEF